MNKVAITGNLKNIITILKEVGTIINDDILSQIYPKYNRTCTYYLYVNFPFCSDITKEHCDDTLNDIKIIKQIAQDNNIHICFELLFDKQYEYWYNKWLYDHNYDNEFLIHRKKYEI